MLGQTAQEKVTTDVKKLEAKNLDDVADQLAKILNTLLESTLNNYTKKADALVMEGSGWAMKVNLSKGTLKQFLDHMIDNCKEKMRTRLATTAQKTQQAQIREFIQNKFDEMGEDIAKELKEAYAEQIEDFNVNLVGVLRNGFQMSVDEVHHYL